MRSHGSASRLMYAKFGAPVETRWLGVLRDTNTLVPFQSKSSSVRRSKKKLDRSRVVQIAHQIYAVNSHVCDDLPKAPEYVDAFVPYLGCTVVR